MIKTNIKKVGISVMFIFSVVLFAGCSTVGLTVSDDVDNNLEQGEWVNINTPSVQKEIK